MHKCRHREVQPMRNAPLFASRLSLFIIVIATLIDISAARASKRLPTSIDRVLPESDAIIFGTITALTPAAEGERAKVTINDTHVIVSRWSLGTELSFSVAGTATDEGCLKPYKSNSHELCVGTRYLLFMRGGDVDSPFLPFTQSIFPMSKEQTIMCAGGEVYGISPSGLVCSKQEYQMSPPLHEAVVTAVLVREHRAGRQRRPGLAAANDRAERELLPTRPDVKEVAP